MSQVDKVNYFPLLFWFIILFLVLYIYFFSFILPLIYRSLKVRSLFFGDLLQSCLLSDLFFSVSLQAYDNFLVYYFLNTLYIISNTNIYFSNFNFKYRTFSVLQ